MFSLTHAIVSHNLLHLTYERQTRIECRAFNREFTARQLGSLYKQFHNPLDVGFPAVIRVGQTDNVDLIAFSSRIERTVKPVRGKPAIHTVLHLTFDLEARRETSDYALAFEWLTERFGKRSLVILLTHAIDEQHLDAISEPMLSHRSPHLFLSVFLRDLGLMNLATKVPRSQVTRQRHSDVKLPAASPDIERDQQLSRYQNPSSHLIRVRGAY